jgi:hypothetical protein
VPPRHEPLGWSWPWPITARERAYLAVNAPPDPVEHPCLAVDRVCGDWWEPRVRKAVCTVHGRYPRGEVNLPRLALPTPIQPSGSTDCWDIRSSRH